MIGKFIRELYCFANSMNTKTIAYGGILQMFVVGINDNYTMAVPNQILSLIAGDYDSLKDMSEYRVICTVISI